MHAVGAVRGGSPGTVDGTVADRLRAYKEKRNFRRTPEPSAKAGKKRGGKATAAKDGARKRTASKDGGRKRSEAKPRARKAPAAAKRPARTRKGSK